MLTVGVPKKPHRESGLAKERNTTTYQSASLPDTPLRVPYLSSLSKFGGCALESCNDVFGSFLLQASCLILRPDETLRTFVQDNQNN
jgi:hypothetical protein